MKSGPGLVDVIGRGYDGGVKEWRSLVTLVVVFGLLGFCAWLFVYWLAGMSNDMVLYQDWQAEAGEALVWLVLGGMYLGWIVWSAEGIFRGSGGGKR